VLLSRSRSREIYDEIIPVDKAPLDTNLISSTTFHPDGVWQELLQEAYQLAIPSQPREESVSADVREANAEEKLSKGSALHGTRGSDGLPACQPCVGIWKAAGCANGKECKFCHLCPKGELKSRQKQKASRQTKLRGCREAAMGVNPRPQLEQAQRPLPNVGMYPWLLPPPIVDPFACAAHLQAHHAHEAACFPSAGLALAPHLLLPPPVVATASLELHSLISQPEPPGLWPSSCVGSLGQVAGNVRLPLPPVGPPCIGMAHVVALSPPPPPVEPPRLSGM